MMIHVSADIEGVTGTTHWNETDRKKAEYAASTVGVPVAFVSGGEGVRDEVREVSRVRDRRLLRSAEAPEVRRVVC